jgi:hypothetical protein
MDHRDLASNKGVRYGIRFADGSLYTRAGGNRSTFGTATNASKRITSMRANYASDPLSERSRAWDGALVVTIIKGEVVS